MKWVIFEKIKYTHTCHHVVRINTKMKILNLLNQYYSYRIKRGKKIAIHNSVLLTEKKRRREIRRGSYINIYT